VRKRVGVSVLMLVLLVDRPNEAQAGAFATEITQILNHGQLIMGYIRQGQELANALEMYREQIRNGLALPSHIFGEIQADLTSLAGIVQGGQALAYSLANLDAQFRTTFTGYGTNSNVYFTRYRNWSTAALDTARGTLRAAGLQGSQLSSEQAVLKALRAQAAEPNGTVRAIQVMADIAEQQTQQLMKLRQIMLADLSSKQAYQAALIQQDAAGKAATEQFFKGSGVSSDGRTFRPGTH
jgi:P-type conjugative transfer protein TrbJ